MDVGSLAGFICMSDVVIVRKSKSPLPPQTARQKWGTLFAFMRIVESQNWSGNSTAGHGPCLLTALRHEPWPHSG